MNRNRLGKRKLFFSIRGGSEENLILPYGKAFNKQKRRMKTIPTIRVEALRARRPALKSG
jgi:hypothetical protein